ncbi:MAG: hypothetical protein IPP42_02215 [Saprospiraceae bacterium]|nr:hypothetical protein [Saprospiraceae bacterium]
MHYYLRYCHDHHPNEELTDDIAKEYILHRYALGLDWQTVNSDYSSIQKFYKNIILMPWNIKKYLDRAKRRNYPLYYPKKMESKSLRMPLPINNRYYSPSFIPQA